MQKMTGVLSALLGAGLIASITLNVCLFREFKAEKQVRKLQNKEKKIIRTLKTENETAKPAKKAVIQQPEPLVFREAEREGREKVFIRLSSYPHELVNLNKKMITVQPAVPFEFVDDYYTRIGIKADFQPETTYRFTVLKGLADKSGGKLDYNAEFEIRFPALPSSMKALSGGLIFPDKRANRILPLEICNVDEIQVRILKLYENNLLRFSMETRWDGGIHALDYGKEIAKKVIPVKIPRNKTINYALDLNRLIPQGKTGVYGLYLTASNKKLLAGEVQLAAAVTDLAPQGVLDELNKQFFASVRRLSDGTAYAGAEVTLISRKFQVMATGVTDADGIVRLDYSKSSAGTDPADCPDGLLVKHGSDIVFQQDLYNKGHSLEEFESTGKYPLGSELRAFTYTERGVYRPGEKVHVTSWLRNPKQKVCAGMPVLIKIQDARMNAICVKKAQTNAAGVIHTTFELPADLPGGRCKVLCQSADENITWGETEFLASEFMPDRIKVELKPAVTELTGKKQTADFTFTAEYYFGGKLDKSPCQFTVLPALAAMRPEWAEWTVGSKEFTAGKKFSRSGKISGEAVKVTYPGFEAQGGKAFRPVVLNAAAEVSEPGGRAVTAHTSVIYHPTPYYLGLQQKSENDQSVVSWKFFPAGKKSASVLKNQKIELTLMRYDWKYMLKKNRGRLTREWVREKVPAGQETISTGDLQSGTWRKKLEGGSYELTAVCGKMRTVLEFWHWYGEGGARSANPGILACTTDKKLYLPGETAKISLKSTVNGFALAAVGSDKLAGYAQYPIVKGKNTLTVRIPADARTEACYCGITMISGEQRQFGLVRFNLDQSSHRLNPVLEVQENAEPNEKIKVKVSLKTPDGKPQAGTVQLFAVDEGILALTAYKLPDIFSFFYGPHHCNFSFTDIYGLLYPDLKIGKDGKIGGDGSPDPAAVTRRNMLREAAPKSAVIVLPPAEVDGSREFEVTLPDHLGAMRLMAVASAPDRTGSGQKMLKMRDKLDIMPTLPQVCAPGDEAELTFVLFNNELKDGKAHFELKLADGKTVTADPLLKKGKQSVFRTRVKIPAREGIQNLTATLTLNGTAKRKELKLPVRLPNPAVKLTVLHTLKPGEKWSPGKNAEFADDAVYTVTVSGSCAGVLKNAVEWLNGYPYGCLEQTVSSAFPFLSADALEKCGVITPDMAKTAKVKANLSAAKILSMMLYNGAFPMWQGGTEEWTGGTVYAAHFLNAGGNLRSSKQRSMLANYLKSLLQNASVSRYERAYSAYVLALMKEGKKEVVTGARNILKSREDDYASFLAAAALLENGFSGEADPHMKRLLAKEIWRLDKSAPHFADRSARAGMTLYILMNQRYEAPEAVAKLRHTLLLAIRNDGSGWGVTHANAWAVLGLAELERNSGKEKSSVSITLPDGRKIQPDPAENPTVKLSGPGRLTVENTGSAAVYVQYQIRGVPIKAQAVQQALKLERKILRNGKKVTSVKQGDLVTVQIRLESTGRVRDLVLSDLLPGGLEIEDERFATRAKGTPSGNRNQKNLILKQEEKRTGEFILSGDILYRGAITVSYRARAVSRGKFAMGSTSAEAMYEPETRAFLPGEGSFEVK